MRLNLIKSSRYSCVGTSCLLFFLLGACQLSPSEQVSRLVKAGGYKESLVSGDGFKHLVLENQALYKLSSKNPTIAETTPATPKHLHVYIEGDGRPWRTRHQIASDPTRGELIALSLMALDSQPSLYLGRPCYFKLGDPACAPEWWTAKRYAQEVRQSLSAVLDRYTEQFDSICIVGFSGGGSLAMLLANYRKDINCVVTIAANLDIEKWAQHHGYSPLQGSINPAALAYNNIQQLHLAAGKDKAVPAQLIKNFVDHQNNQQSNQQSYQQPDTSIRYRLYKEFSHRCCWKKIWPEVLNQLTHN